MFKKKTKKPRVRFCWACGNKLWGNRHTEAFVYGHMRILHKTCAKAILKGKDDELSES